MGNEKMFARIFWPLTVTDFDQAEKNEYSQDDEDTTF